MMQSESQNIEHNESCWDDIPVYGATLDDIDRNAIDYFLQRSIKAGRMDEEEANASTEHVLRNLGLYTKDGELKNAAILLFGKDVRQFFPAAMFKIGRFHTDESDLIIQDVIDGNLIQMASRVMKTLRTKYLLSPIHYEGLQRIEQLEVPDKALRELIYNAISHKDYTGPAIQMRIYDKSIELWNYGLLPKELTPAKLLQKHSSFPRNHNIANAFYKAGFVESWGRGFKKIAEEFEKAKLPLPTIEEECGGVMAVIQRKTVDEIIQERDNGGNVGGSGGNMAVIKLSNRQKLILSYIIKNSAITAKQMAVMTDIPQRTIEREISALQKMSVLQRVGAPRTGKWAIMKDIDIEII